MTTKTNVVYYKFNSTNTWRHIKQTAVITLNDLEKHISNYTQIGDCNHTNKEVSCSCQFRLSFYDSTRHKEINDRHRALDRNSHIVVKRYPMNKKNITRIEKKMVLKHEMEAKAASLKAIAKKKKIEDDKDEAKKKANVEARLKELEDERWERARIAHEREVAELKLELEKTNDKKRFLINSKSKKDKINCSSKTLSRKRHFKSHEDNGINFASFFNLCIVNSFAVLILNF